MISSSPTCDPQRVQRLLQGDLTVAEESLATEHIESCSACRTRLETLAAEQSWWLEAGRHLRNSEWQNDGSLRLSPDQNDDQPLGSHGVAPGDSWITSLEFLEPTDNPAMLGRLGTYEILETIGSGGFGIVLKGYDRELNRYVAVKVLAPHLAHSAAARKRFAREAQSAAAVVHAHVVAIHAVDSAGKLPYLVMPFVAGESLQQRLDRQGALDLKEVLRIGMQTAQGLSAAHSQGVVHRDIKPGNILLEHGVDRVLLTDFGLARTMDDAGLTRSTVIAGTPQYMSPEQARGDTVDHRSDLFSLGSVLYAMCTGHPPFRAETLMGVLRRIADTAPRDVRESNPEIPGWLVAIIERLHELNPEKRFHSAAEVAGLLEQCLAHVQQPTVIALPKMKISPLARVARFTRNRRVLAGLVTIAAGVLLVFAAIGVYAAIQGTFPQSSPTDTGNSPTSTAGSFSLPTTNPDIPTKPVDVQWADEVEQELTEIESRLQWLEVFQNE